MSAYVLAPENFDALLSVLMTAHPQQDASRAYALLSALDMDDRKDNLERDAKAEAFVADLYRMNNEAVAVRYRLSEWDAPREFKASFSYRHSSLPLPTIFGIAECLLYQCSEGDVPESETYKRLDRWVSALGRAAAKLSPGYSWGLK